MLGAGTGRSFLVLSSYSHLSSPNLLFYSSERVAFPIRRLSLIHRLWRTCCYSTFTATNEPGKTLESARRPMLLEKLRIRQLKDNAGNSPEIRKTTTEETENNGKLKAKKMGRAVSTFQELGLTEELKGAVREMGISVPTEIQCLGIPVVLEGKSVVLGSHTGSGKTLAYMLPLIQMLRLDEAVSGTLMKPRHPRAVVLCPTRELSEQVFRVAKSISHHARFRSVMVGGGGRLRPQEDSLNAPTDMVVGTPGRILQHIGEGHMVYGSIKYLVLDEADTMFDHGFGPDILKFLAPLKSRASKPEDLGFQTVLVAATMTKAVQKLIDEEFQGILHLRTSTLHKKIATARHEFIKLTGAENKLESLLQVLEPSLIKGNKIMVFCNTLNSSRAVDHFLSENQIFTVNYHGEVPAEQRVENLEKFKSDDGDCPTLVCTDLAARGLDLDVDHVIMFDFPLNSIDYLHRTGRTARMGAKGKVTSLVVKKDLILASRIEEAIKKNQSLESLTLASVRKDAARAQLIAQKGRATRAVKCSGQMKTGAKSLFKPHRKAVQSTGGKSGQIRTRSSLMSKAETHAVLSKSSKSLSNSKGDGRTKAQIVKGVATKFSGRYVQTRNGRLLCAKAKSPVMHAKSEKSSLSGSKRYVKRRVESQKFSATKSGASKLSVVGFRGRNSAARRTAT